MITAPHMLSRVYHRSLSEKPPSSCRYSSWRIDPRSLLLLNIHSVSRRLAAEKNQSSRTRQATSKTSTSEHGSFEARGKAGSNQMNQPLLPRRDFQPPFRAFIRRGLSGSLAFATTPLGTARFSWSPDLTTAGFERPPGWCSSPSSAGAGVLIFSAEDDRAEERI